jgi:putative membrane protein
MAHDPSPPASYIFNDFNQPFAPADRRTASELLSQEKGSDYLDERNGMENIHATLVRSWRSVTHMTINPKRKIAA